MLKKLLAIIAVCSIFSVGIVGCSSSQMADDEIDDESGRYTVMVTNFPLYDLTKQIVGDKGRVNLLSDEAGQNYKYTDKDVNRLNNADVLIYMGTQYDGWVDDALKDANMTNDDLFIVDASKNINTYEDISLYNYADESSDIVLPYNFSITEDSFKDDGSVWMSLDNAEKMINTISNYIANYDFQSAEIYSQRENSFMDSLKNLRERYTILKNNSKNKLIVIGGSFNYYYLSKWLGLNVVSIYDMRLFEEDAQASAKRVAGVAEFMKNNDIQMIISDKNSPNNCINSIASDTECYTVLFDDMTSIDKKDFDKKSYLEIMEDNYSLLKQSIY